MADMLMQIVNRFPDVNARMAEFSAVLDDAAARGDGPLVEQYINLAMSDATPSVVSRRMVSNLIPYLRRFSPEIRRPLIQYMLQSIGDRSQSYELDIIALRQDLARLFADGREWRSAALVLADLPFDSSSPNVTDSFRADSYVRIARYFIEADDHVTAERYTTRAGLLMEHCPDQNIILMHKFCVARILDFKHKFEDAAMKYYQLSQCAQEDLGESISNDTKDALNFAIICAILAPAGPRRSRVLSILYHDERSSKLHVFAMLETIHMGGLLKPEQVEMFRPTLRRHHVGIDNDGVSVLDRAVLEHNLLAVSRLYCNIRIEDLAALLSVSREKAESTAARMIFEGRMTAVIDQMEGFVEFQTPGSRAEILQWDAQIESICAVVDSCCDSIINRYPQFAR